MYRFYINKVENDYHYDELIRVFLPDNEFETILIDIDDSKYMVGDNSFIINLAGNLARDEIKKELYMLLHSITGKTLSWGTITGVRPLKIALDLYSKHGDINKVVEILKNLFLVSDNKIKLLRKIIDYQTKHISKPLSNKVSIYIGIPFCPSRCLYCSFESNVANQHQIDKYLKCLKKEIEYIGKLIIKNNIDIESVYIGGGTPTTLSANQIDILLKDIEENFSINLNNIEYTVEAGRPDTISREKLQTINEHGIRRISINPQSMKDETLNLIGRKHNSNDIVEAFQMAREVGFDAINADIIAGLPNEKLSDFKNTLEKIVELGAENITVHTLSIKRGSRLIEIDPDLYRKNIEEVKDMLVFSQDYLDENGYFPYYIYKQKHQIGAFENVGYCKVNKHSLYNIRIMEEKQTIIGLGAGGIGKTYYPDEDRLERVPNVCNYEIYIERINEMLERKNKYFGGNHGN